MVKDQNYNLLGVLKTFVIDFMKDYTGNPSWEGGIRVFPRVEVYQRTSGSDIDKDSNSKPVEVTFDIVTESKDEGQCLKIGESFYNYLSDNPISVPDFNIDLEVLNGTQVIEELGSGNRTIHRNIINYTYNLTQV